MQQNINAMLGQNAEAEGNNPLANLDEAAKDASKTPKKGSSTANLDEETIKQLLMTGENSNGMFAPDEKELKKELVNDELHAETDEKARVKIGKADASKSKYANAFQEDIMKKPNKYKIMTPRGEMTVAEAMKKGYNPITKRFEKEKDIEKLKAKHLEGLNEADKAKINELTDPSAARIPAKEASQYGVEPDSPMIEGNTTNPAQAISTATPTPGETPMPEGEGSTDIASLLGGAN